MGDYEVLVE